MEGWTVEASGPDAPLALLEARSGGGPPFWIAGRFQPSRPGLYRVALKNGDCLVKEREIRIPSLDKPSIGPAAWESESSWTRPMENLFAAWIERLFLDAEEGDTWTHLQAVIRDASRNILYGFLGEQEDSELILKPDCADNPFFLRAYFAWKLRLPFGMHRCDRGTDQHAPRCGEWITNQLPRMLEHSETRVFQAFSRTIMNCVHSGSGRTALDDDRSDLYPLPLQRASLRPGAVFADPYGHTLILVRWIEQTPNSSGKLLAVDAQPDGTIALKRFWQGNFLFETQNIAGGPGFKAFRPIVLEKAAPQTLSNSEILKNPDYGNFSLEQQNLSQQEFYDRMEKLINPEPLEPETAFHELHEAVFDRLLARALAVANGERYMQANGFALIPMPSGAGIFQTTGPWEDFSTPARDMRFLIALDVLRDFPARVERTPEAFRIENRKTPVQVRIQLEILHRKWSQEYTFTYLSSNGIERKLSLADVLDRSEALEMGYNPNDCIEIRWGTPPESRELVSCSRRAPLEQQKKMSAYRHWFRERIFPVR